MTPIMGWMLAGTTGLRVGGSGHPLEDLDGLEGLEGGIRQSHPLRDGLAGWRCL